MNSKTIARTIATGSVMAAFFAVTACGTEVAPPAQTVTVDRPSPSSTATERHATENSGWMRKGGTTGNHKQPPDSRP